MVYFYNGVVLFNSGAVAMHADCCCEPPTETVLDCRDVDPSLPSLEIFQPNSILGTITGVAAGAAGGSVAACLNGSYDLSQGGLPGCCNYWIGGQVCGSGYSAAITVCLSPGGDFLDDFWGPALGYPEEGLRWAVIIGWGTSDPVRGELALFLSDLLPTLTGTYNPFGTFNLTKVDELVLPGSVDNVNYSAAAVELEVE